MSDQIDDDGVGQLPENPRPDPVDEAEKLGTAEFNAENINPRFREVLEPILIRLQTAAMKKHDSGKAVRSRSTLLALPEKLTSMSSWAEKLRLTIPSLD